MILYTASFSRNRRQIISYMYRAIKANHFYDALSSCNNQRLFLSRKLLKSRLPFPCSHSRKILYNVESDWIITRSCHHAGFLQPFKALRRECCDLLSHSPATRPINDTRIFHSRVVRRKTKSKLTHTAGWYKEHDSWQHCLADTGRQQLQSQSHNIRNYKSGTCFLCCWPLRPL